MTVWSLTPCRDCGIPTSGSVAPGGIVYLDRCPECVHRRPLRLPPPPPFRCEECRFHVVPAPGRLCEHCLGTGLGRAVRTATLGQALLVAAVLAALLLAIGAWL